jgi:uncharacterized paraquat-inducible protein A
MSILGLGEPPKEPARARACPECNQMIAREEIQFSRLFPCPRCGKPICVPSSYRTAVLLIALIPSLGVPYLLGVRNAIPLLVVALVILMPVVSGALIMFARSMLPLKLEPYDPTGG